MRDDKERQRLIDSNVPFVRSVAAKIREQLPREIEFDDLVAYGMQGLLEAAERFNPRQGTSFTTFAYYRVRGAVFDGLRHMGWLPRGEYARLRVEERSTAFFQNLADRESGNQTGQTQNLEDDVLDLAQALNGVATIFVTSLDAQHGAQASSPSAALPEQDYALAERSHVIKAALKKLPEKERRLIELFYYEDRSLSDAGALLGLSKSWSSRLHARAISLLQRALAKQKDDL